MQPPRFVLVVAVALLVTAAVRAQTEPGTVGAHDRFVLDEYNVEAFGGGDSTRIAAGLTFGSAYANGWWWNAGPRLSYIRWDVDGQNEDGFGAGGTFGGGWEPERTVSPYGAITLDRTFNVSGAFDWQSTVHFGARVKITPDAREYFTMTFSVFQTYVFGGDGPNDSDLGIAVLYSAALFAKKR